MRDRESCLPSRTGCGRDGRSESDSSRFLQTSRKVGWTGARYEETVGIVSVRKPNDAGLQACIAELRGKFRCRTLTGSIRVGVEGDEDLPAGIVRDLGELIGGEVAPECACGVAKAGLPQDGEIEEAFHEDDGLSAPKRFPRNQAAFGARQKPMGWRLSDAAPIEIDDAALLAAGENDAAEEAVTPLLID